MRGTANLQLYFLDVESWQLYFQSLSSRVSLFQHDCLHLCASLRDDCSEDAGRGSVGCTLLDFHVHLWFAYVLIIHVFAHFAKPSSDCRPSASSLDIWRTSASAGWAVCQIDVLHMCPCVASLHCCKLGLVCIFWVRAQVMFNEQMAAENQSLKLEVWVALWLFARTSLLRTACSKHLQKVYLLSLVQVAEFRETFTTFREQVGLRMCVRQTEVSNSCFAYVFFCCRNNIFLLSCIFLVLAQVNLTERALAAMIAHREEAVLHVLHNFSTSTT